MKKFEFLRLKIKRLRGETKRKVVFLKKNKPDERTSHQVCF